ncbi:MAG: sel1 repeat family protein, partial [Nitrospirae bacterium]|nr:sel1 repeat family protein [Nitrospirota bacterium]
HAQHNLGLMHAKGEGVPRDFKEAVRWYRLAAEQGEARDQGNLGLMYAKGKGVLQDYVLAHMWFNLAAEQGEKVASDLRDSLAKKMTPAQIAEAQKLASEWKPRDK